MKPHIISQFPLTQTESVSKYIPPFFKTTFNNEKYVIDNKIICIFLRLTTIAIDTSYFIRSVKAPISISLLNIFGVSKLGYKARCG